MSTKAQLKAIRDLHQKKGRLEQGRFIVQGSKLLSELLGSSFSVESIHATGEAAERMRMAEAEVLPDHELQRLGTLEHGNEVVAVVNMPAWSEVKALEVDELVLALDGVSDPGNLGTVLRIADWFGVRRVLCSTDSVDVFNPKCVQSSMGSIFRVEVHYVDLPERLSLLRSQGAALHVASMEGRSVVTMEMRRPTILVLGNESHGVSAAIRALQGELVAVPRYGQAESLNVAMAASALCMEYARQFSVGKEN
jgi:TrmH family RNA methyltransferase